MSRRRVNNNEGKRPHQQSIQFDPQLPPVTFPLFSSLPKELRLKIFSLLPPPPRVVRAHYCHKTGRLKPLSPPPTLLITCSESRAELLSAMGWVLAFGTPANNACVCVNFAIDAVQLNLAAMQYGAALRSEDLLATRHLEIRGALTATTASTTLLAMQAPAAEGPGGVRIVRGILDFGKLETFSLVMDKEPRYEFPGLLRGWYDFLPLLGDRYDFPEFARRAKGKSRQDQVYLVDLMKEVEHGTEKMRLVDLHWRTMRDIDMAALSSDLWEKPLVNFVAMRDDGSRCTKDGEFIREWARVGEGKFEEEDFGKENKMRELNAMRLQRRRDHEHGMACGGQA